MRRPGRLVCHRRPDRLEAPQSDEYHLTLQGDAVTSHSIAVLLLAADGGQPAGPPQGSLLTMLAPFIIIMFLFYFLLMRPQKKEQQRRQEMLSAVKKNDRVVTVGGVYGVVTNVRTEADEVTVKVDEATNTKLRMTLSSIARIITDEPDGDSK